MRVIDVSMCWFLRASTVLGLLLVVLGLAIGITRGANLPTVMALLIALAFGTACELFLWRETGKILAAR